MASCALFRCGLVEEHRLPVDELRQLVAVGAAHVLVRPPQRECRLLLMIEERGSPLHGVVAVDAARNLSLGELLAVDVFMAIFTLSRRRLEINID